MTAPSQLFPLPKADSFFLPVSDGHHLYVETCGPADGEPVLVVHGGPGGGINPRLRQFFAPDYWRVVLFDQRGAGLSTPAAGLEHNTTQALIEDMEALRTTLGIEKWWLFGGSWGSTLSLLYAQAHPDRCSGLLLRGIYLGRKRDTDWLYGPDGVARLYPEAWQDFVRNLPATDSTSVIAFYHDKLALPDAQAMPWAKRWAGWEGRISTLLPNQEVEASFDARALAIARIENHYFYHQCFIERSQILDHAASLKGVPGYIAQGRYDVVCPPDQADALVNCWPDVEITMVPACGHSSSEPAMEQALLENVAKAQRRKGGV